MVRWVLMDGFAAQGAARALAAAKYGRRGGAFRCGIRTERRHEGRAVRLDSVGAHLCRFRAGTPNASTAGGGGENAGGGVLFPKLRTMHEILS